MKVHARTRSRTATESEITTDSSLCGAMVAQEGVLTGETRVGRTGVDGP
jgi:hypothetical protein